ncbi:MAG: OmpA family protein [Myxococcota bacterium]
MRIKLLDIVQVTALGFGLAGLGCSAKGSVKIGGETEKAEKATKAEKPEKAEKVAKAEAPAQAPASAEAEGMHKHKMDAAPTATTPAATTPAATEPAQAAAPKGKKSKRAAFNRKTKRVDIEDKVQFEVNMAEIKAESNTLLDDVAQVLSENPTISVEIGGHTDDTGAAEHNRKLSASRAEAVKHYLVSRGIAAERLTVKGFGSDKPIDPEKSDIAREKNRRVEFLVTSP